MRKEELKRNLGEVERLIKGKTAIRAREILESKGFKVDLVSKVSTKTPTYEDVLYLPKRNLIGLFYKGKNRIQLLTKSKVRHDYYDIVIHETQYLIIRKLENSIIPESYEIQED
jgi:hypothetical protein